MAGELFVLGDRVLMAPDSEKTRTESGLYLPQGMAAKEKVQSGRVVKVGPGYIVPSVESSEPWEGGKGEPKFIPLQVKVGDYAIFLRREGVEIEFGNAKYVIVPQAAIVAVVRDTLGIDEL
jgi:chaperonin GroES